MSEPPGKPSAQGEWTVSGLRGRTPEPEIARADPERPIPTRRGMLSAAEIEALLRPDLSDLEPEPDTAPAPATQPLEPAALDAPPPAAPDAAALAARMTAALRRQDLAALSFAAASPGDNRNGAPAEPSGVHVVFETAEQDPVAVLHLQGGLACALIELLCGHAGPSGAGSAPPSALSALSRRLLAAALAPLAGVLSREAGQPLQLARIETEARFARILDAGGPARTLSLTAELDHRVSPLTLTLSPPEAFAPPAPAVSLLPASTGLPEGIETRLRVRLARLSVPVSAIARWKPGHTLLTGLPADQPVEIMSGAGESARVMAEGEIGRAGDRLAVRVRRLRAPLLRRD